MADENKGPQGEGAASQKTKKINRMTADEIKKKIGDLESANQTKSVYFKHLLQRKNEMEKPAAS